MRFNIIYAIFTLITVPVFSQDNPGQITGRLKSPIVNQIGNIEQFTTYRKNKVIFNQNGKKYREPKIYFEFPAGFIFNYSEYKAKQNVYFFSNGEQVIAILYNLNNVAVGKESNNLDQIIQHKNIQLDSSKCKVIYNYGEYFVYYYNVEKTNENSYIEAIKSIRYQKRR